MKVIKLQTQDAICISRKPIQNTAYNEVQLRKTTIADNKSCSLLNDIHIIGSV